jgi:hypothetical protein
MDSSGGDDPVGHVRHFASWYLAHRLDNVRVERGLFDPVFMI